MGETVKKKRVSRRRVAKPAPEAEPAPAPKPKSKLGFASDCSYKDRPLFEPGCCCCPPCLRMRGGL
jgi:hypothetical protein